MRSETQPYSTVIAIRLCRTAHAIFFPKFWNDKTNFTRVFVTVSPRRPWAEVAKMAERLKKKNIKSSNKQVFVASDFRDVRVARWVTHFIK